MEKSKILDAQIITPSSYQVLSLYPKLVLVCVQSFPIEFALIWITAFLKSRK